MSYASCLHSSASSRKKSEVIQTEHLAALYFIPSLPVLLERIAEAILCAVYFVAVLVAYPIQKIHIAIFTAFGTLLASVPRVPYIVHIGRLPSVYGISSYLKKPL